MLLQVSHLQKIARVVRVGGIPTARIRQLAESTGGKDNSQQDPQLTKNARNSCMLRKAILFKLEKNISLADLSTFKIGGIVKEFQNFTFAVLRR